MNKHIKNLKKLKSWKFWQYVIDNKDELKLILDNDSTIVVLIEEKDEDEYVYAPEYLGNSQGISDFLNSLEINFEHC